MDPVAGIDQLKHFVDQCLEMGCSAACVPPWLVSKAAARLAGSPVAVCSVVGFPTGSETAKIKCLQAEELSVAGAQELDICLNRGLVLSGRLDEAIEEMRMVAASAGTAVLKIILEVELLGEEVSRTITEALADTPEVSLVASGSGAYGPARAESISLLSETADGRMGVKAAGGVADLATALAMIEAGADRIGTSRGYSIWREAKELWSQDGLSS